jgi:hypothetical protein
MNTDTLLGGRKLTITFNDKTTREVTVRQIQVREYVTLFPKLDHEIALVAAVCGIPANEIGAVDPTSYELLYAAVQEVNEKGFFVWSARQLARAQNQMAGMPPEMVKQIMERTVSAAPSPSMPPPLG